MNPFPDLSSVRFVLAGAARNAGTPSSLICLRHRRVNIILLRAIRALKKPSNNSKFLETNLHLYFVL